MKKTEKSPSIVILANGEPPSHDIPLGILNSADFIVCCDGAYGKLRRLGREPDYVVGDCDSISEKEIGRIGERLVKISEQETNDLSKAFFFTVDNRSWRKPVITILGACGLREDHTVGNIFRLLDFIKDAPDVTMVSNHGVFTPVTGSKRFRCIANSPISIFAPFPGTKIKSMGLKWKLDGLKFTSLHSATLNQTTAKTFSVATSKPIIVYTPFPECTECR